jgi:hypothetical protein
MFNGSTFPTTGTNPNIIEPATGWTGFVDVGNESMGTETTQPSGINFALASGSPAIGIGVHESYLLPPHDEDAGACYHTLTQCPLASAEPAYTPPSEIGVSRPVKTKRPKMPAKNWHLKSMYGAFRAH